MSPPLVRRGLSLSYLLACGLQGHIIMICRYNNRRIKEEWSNAVNDYFRV